MSQRYYFKCTVCQEECRRPNEKSKEGEWFERLRRQRKLEARGKKPKATEFSQKQERKEQKQDEKMLAWLKKMQKTSL